MATTTTSTWKNGISADWSVAGNWNPAGVPNDAVSNAVIALINAAPAAGTVDYTVTISAGEQFSTGGARITNAGATLSVTGAGSLLDLGGGALAVQAGRVTLNGGTIFNIGSLSGLVSGNGTIFNPGATLINSGTILNDGGAFFELAPLTNTGTLMTSGSGGSFLGVQTTSFSNLSNGTLTGGTYIAQGTNLASFNLIQLPISASSPATTLAATLILDGPGAGIGGTANNAFFSIGTQLRTIAAGGTLQLLNGASFTDTGTLTDAGLLTLNGGTLSSSGLTVSGTFQGFGTITGGVTNAGGSIGVMGRLVVPGSIGGSGSLSLANGGTLLVQGASAPSLTNNGTIFNTAGFLNLGSVTGSGTIVVYNGASIEVAGSVAAGQTILFGGANVTARLDSPLAFNGTLAGFGPGDSAFAGDKLVLAGVTGTSAQIVNSNTLSVTTSGSPVNIALAGNYTGAVFSVSAAGGNTTVQQVSGGPVRSGFSAIVTLNDQAGLSATVQNNIITDLQAAVSAWAQYLTGAAPLRISLTITSASQTSSGELADAKPTSSIDSGVTSGGKKIFTPSSAFALNNGIYQPNTAADIDVTIPGGSSNINRLFINPTPGTGTVPSDKFDLVSILTHELGHGLVFSGLANNATGSIGANIFPYDNNLQIAASNGTITSASFTGANAQTAYGAFLGTNVPTPVPLNTGAGSALYHIANSTTDPLGNDLMFSSILAGTTKTISAVDIGFARDAGLPVTASVMPCYVAGTRIATPDGDAAVEALRPGDRVTTLDGTVRPVVWAGWRTVAVTRHPSPHQVRPVVIEPDAFGPGLPARTLRVSPDHAIFIDGDPIPARLLVNGTSIRIDTACRSVTYHHIELDRHDIVLAEGLPAESYLETGRRHMYANGGATIALHPDFTARVWETEGCAPLVLTGPRLEAARARLGARVAPPRGRRAAARAKRRAS